MDTITSETFLQASQGNMDAFHTIYTVSAGFVYATALRVTCNEQDAQEVTQDVFMKAYKNLQCFEIDTSFKAWIYRITFNAAINAYHKRSAERKRRDQFQKYNDKKYALPEAEKTIRQKEHHDTVMSLLETLNPAQRACIVLREIEEYDYQEIAHLLNININTVKSRLKRARETLMRYAKIKELSYEL